MKCIKHTVTGEVRRVTDEKAFAMTSQIKHWNYCDKEEWKKYRGMK